jgi:5'-3' exonuclease
LAQCVRGDRVVQVHRSAKKILDAEGVRQKYGVEPALIPDFLALVGDAADGYPGIPGIGSVTARQLLNRHGPIESFPPAVLGDRRDLALLFKNIATLRTDAPLFHDVDELRWHGPTRAFASWTQRAPPAGARSQGPCTARRSAARGSRRVESSVGSGEFASSMINGISVQRLLLARTETHAVPT